MTTVRVARTPVPPTTTSPASRPASHTIGSATNSSRKTRSAKSQATPVAPACCYHERVFVLTGGTRGAGKVLEELLEAGLGHVSVSVGENLGMPEQRIRRGTPEQLLEFKIPPLAVLLVENPALDPSARSFMGAQGLMQVMPFHRGKWPPCEPRLDDVESNICHGASIFASYLKQTGGDVDRALLRYNGCVHGTNTPNCHQYANHVFARAGRASVHAWLVAGTMGASP